MKKGLSSIKILVSAMLAFTPAISSAAVTLYTDYNAWLAAVNASSQNIEASSFAVNHANVSNEGNSTLAPFPTLPSSSDSSYEATRMDSSYDGNNVNLGNYATFNNNKTGFPISFEVHAEESDSSHGNARIYYNDVPYGKTFEQTDAFTDVLSIGKFNGFTSTDFEWDNDDFSIEITNDVTVYGIGFNIVNNKQNVAESIEIYADESDSNYLVRFDNGSIPGYTGGYDSNFDDVRFIGIVADTPFTFIEFDEGDSYNDIGLSNFYFATPIASLERLNVNSTGTGSGSFSINPAGTDCGSSSVICMDYANGTSVTVTATPSSGDTFVSWSGCGSTSGTSCTVSMTETRNITATFEENLDTDNDGTQDDFDNCPTISNANQTDSDADGAGNLCDAFPNNADETKDSDGDGMGDNFEDTYGLNKNDSADAALDSDNDDYTNLEEFEGGTNPTSSGSSPAPDTDNDGHKDSVDNCPAIYNEHQTNTDGDSAGNLCDAFPSDSSETADTDGDGMGDNFEMTYGFNVNSSADAAIDTDGDELTNLEEFEGGSNPLDRNSPIEQEDEGDHATYSGDFNGDGKDDILWRHATTGTNWLYLMNGSTITQSTKINTVADLNWKIVGIGDLNNDGKDDILWRHAISGVNWVYSMNAQQIIQSKALSTISDKNWQVAGLGDLNGDGTDDIVWRNSVTGENVLYLMNELQIIHNRSIYSVADTNWHIVGLGDLNGDGNEDLLWRHATAGTNWAYMMDGFVVLQSGKINTLADTNWKVVGIKDTNSDGMADIFWRNSQTGSNWLYQMNSFSLLSSKKINAVSDLNWKIEQVGDFNNDGKADVLWRNHLTGLNWIYLLDGVTITQNQAVNRLTDTGWKVVPTTD